MFEFVESCDFEASSRAWKRADLFTLIVEVHRATVRQNMILDPKDIGFRLKDFYGEVDGVQPSQFGSDDVSEYHKAALQATNDRRSRITRGKTVAGILGAKFDSEQVP